MVLDRVESTKFLGVIVDSRLTWNAHITSICSKIARGVSALTCARYHVPRKLLLWLYHSLIYPHLIYCNIVWGSAASSRLNRLVSLQKRAIRILSGSHYYAHTSPLFLNLKLLKLVDINKYLIVQFLFKHKYLLLPASCMHLVKVNSIDHMYNTRKCVSYFTKPNCRTMRQELEISHRGPVIWNSLPAAITQLSYISVFQKTVLAYFFSTY